MPLSVVPVVPHGAANRAGESKGRFQNGSAEMAREREREENGRECRVVLVRRQFQLTS